MSRSRMAIILAGAAILIGIGGVSVMSVNYAKGRGTGERTTFFSFGGRAELQNVIEIPLEQVEGLTLEYGSKNIRFYPSGEDNVVIEEYLYSGKEEAKATLSWTGEKEARVAGGNERAFVVFGFFYGEGERIEVYIPEKSLKNLSVHTGSGNITSETDCIQEKGSLAVSAGSGNVRWKNARGKEVQVEAGSGNVGVENISGDIRLHTGSGNITGTILEGNVDVGAGSGNVKLEDFAGGGSLETNSGNITAKVEDLTGDLRLKAGSGNVRLEMRENVSFHFKVETGSGNINTDFEQALSYNKKGNQAQGDVGEDPTWNVEARTGSGNVKVERR